MSIQKEPFGHKNGEPAYAYTLSNASGTRVRVSTFGAAVVNLWVKDKNGVEADVVTGFDSAESYALSGGAPGCIVGRIANRTAGAAFDLDGVHYQLYANDGRHQLHGGKEGFHRKLWTAEASDGAEPSVKLTRVSPDGEENYPGTLTASVTYTLTKDGALAIDYDAVSDKKTPVSMTNHCYFNLNGYASGVIDDCVLCLDADFVTEVDHELIPTGRSLDVTGTAYDFRKPKRIGDGYGDPDPIIRQNGGYDNNYELRPADGVRKIAVLKDPRCSRVLTVYTDQPSVQVYTANMIRETDAAFKGGVRQYKHCGVCLETQKTPDAMHHPEFPSIVIAPGEHYVHHTVYAFTNE